jgi:uncharacterized cupin superfamily protein
MLNKTKSTPAPEAQSEEVLDIFGAAMFVKSDASTIPVFMAEHVVPPGYMVPPHSHANEDEVFYLLEGELTLISPAGERTARAGDCITLPRGQVHGFRNASDSPLRFLVMCLPGVQATEMFRHLDRESRLARGALAPEKIIGICAQYDVTMAG